MSASPLELFDNALPPITEGDYTLSAEIEVTIKESKDAAKYKRSQAVRVAGPAAGLAPGDVVAVSPPDGSTGMYAAWVPNITLARQTLPWEVGIDDQARTVPWLAVVVLRRSQIIGPPDKATGTSAYPLSEYLNPPLGYVKPNPSKAVAATWAATTPSPIVNTADARVSDVLAALPPVASLPLLCHVRDTSAAPDIGAAATPIPISSTVLANVAVPAEMGEPLVAHLVNIDGFVSGLWSAGDGQMVRFISLASWSFRSEGTCADFGALARALTAGTFGVADEAAPASSPSTLCHLPGLDQGTATATYSGPLVPPVAPPRAPTDIGLDAAWQLGRLLLLSNRIVLGAILAWAEAGMRAAQLAHERSALSGALPLESPAPPDRTGARAALVQTLSSGALRQVVTEGFHERRPPRGAPPEVLSVSRPASRARPRHEAVRALLARPEALAAAVTQAGDAPPGLLAWVDSVRHLGPIPFAYMTPDPVLLPNEGIRFFFVDGGWTAQVVAGAFSLVSTVPTGRGDAARDSMVSTMADALLASIPADTTTRCGFLLRSQLVAEWPNLGVRAWADTARKTQLATTVTRPAPNLMLAVIDGVAQRIDLQLSVQGLNLTLPTGAPTVSAWATAQSLTSAAALADRLINAAAKPSRQSFVIGGS